MTDIEYLKKHLDSDLEEGIEKLNKGMPVQYIVGNVNFCGNIIEVNENSAANILWCLGSL